MYNTVSVLATALTFHNLFSLVFHYYHLYFFKQVELDHALHEKWAHRNGIVKIKAKQAVHCCSNTQRKK